MNRNFYIVGIAFFGLINGMFNSAWLLFAFLHVRLLAPTLLFDSVSLALLISSLMVSAATVILGGIPAAIYEHMVGAKASTDVSSSIWLAGTTVVALLGISNILVVGMQD